MLILKYIAADFLMDLEEALISKRIGAPSYKILLNDMADILDKVNENERPSATIEIRQSDSTLSFNSSSYQRLYFEGSSVMLLEQWLVKGGIVHREGNNDLPARIFYNLDGTVESEEWLDHGVRKRGGAKPAYIEYESKM